MIVIGGATATGKTTLGIEVAKALNGEIVSADSMQIYKGMDIGTAKPSTEEMCGIPHYLIDVIEPNEPFSVAEFKVRAEEAIKKIKNKGKVPIVVGGTGLYINALIYNYSPAETNDKLRKELWEEYEKYGAERMYGKLSQIDEKAAKTIHPNNVKRVLRALEVMLLTGKSIAEKNDKEFTVPNLTYICDREREILYKNINDRVDSMFEKGLEKEVKGLVESGKVNFGNQSMQAIGYKEFRSYFAGSISIEQVKNDIKQHTRNYAKRQISWFKTIETGIWVNCEEIEHNRDRIINDYYKYFCKL